MATEKPTPVMDTQQKKWHVDKTVNISHIVATIILALGMFSWAKGIEKVQTEHTKDIQSIKERMEWSDQRLKDDLTDIKQSIKELSAYVRESNKR